MREIIGELARLRQRSRLLLVVQGLAVVLAWVGGVMIVLGLADYVLRLPSVVRIILLMAGVAVLAWWAMRHFRPVLQFRPSLTDVALRVERALPDLGGRLASSIEFAAAGLNEQNEFAARSIRETESRASGASMDSVIDFRRTRRDVAALAGVAAVAALLIVVSPAGAQTALARLLAPWSGAKWPARTAIQSLMADVTVHPRGAALPLRAEATKAPGGRLNELRIIARYRLETAGNIGAWKEVVLTPQDQAPGLYERLVDTDADAIEFAFEADDSVTAVERIVLSPPPSVLSAMLSITPPPYARPHVPAFESDLGPGVDERAITETPALAGSEVELAIVLNKAIPIPSDRALQELWLRSSLGWPQGVALPRLAVEETGTGSAQRFDLRWRLEETVALHFNLVDEHKLSNVDEIAYRINAVTDREPTVTMTAPESDQTVLATAVVPLVAEARDDVALKGMGLEAMLAPRTDSAGDAATPLWRDSEVAQSAAATMARELDLVPFALKEGNVVEVVGIAKDVFDLDGITHEPARSPARRLRVISDRDFGEALFQELKALRQNAIRLEGQQAELQDDIIDDGVQPGVQRAQERIGERVTEQLEALRRLRERRDLNRFEDAQLGALIDQSEDLLSHAGRASNQAVEQIDSRERDQQQAGEEPANQDEANADREEQRGDDAAQAREGAQGEPGQVGDQRAAGESADQQERQQGETTDDAGQQAAEGEQAEEPGADEDSSPPDEADPEAAMDEQPAERIEVREPRAEDQPIVDAQQEVRDELRDLIQLLDDNEDTWLMGQKIRDLLEAQTALQGETQTLADQTMGSSPEQLDPVELTELDRIDQRQRELAEEMRELVDELRDRANEMEDVDPQAAAGQRSAAETAEQREIDRHMEDAARSASQNQLQNAQNSQQRAREGLERMQQDLDRKRARAEELQRRLESLVESIKRLVTVQESEIAALDVAVQANDYAGRDRAMIRLNQNTQAVSGEARAAGREADRIARALDRAGDAQGAAIAALRASPILSADVQAGEMRSLEMLREALAVAEQMEQQLEEDIVQQRREELVKAYLELAEREAALRGDTLELAALEDFDRRALVEARMQGSRQEEIRIAVADVLARTSEISESLVFEHVHTLVDEWAQEVNGRLREGVVNTDVTDREHSIAESLARLAQALEEEQAEPNEFEEGSEEGGGGGGGGGQQGEQPLVPALSELKLLRGLQEQIYNQTRDIDGRSDLEQANRRQRLRELQREQEDLQRLGEQLLEQLTPQQPPADGGPPQGVPQ